MTDTSKDRGVKLTRNGVTDGEAAEYLFPNILRRRFWMGVLVGMFLMAILDVPDVNICVGECDDLGLSLTSGFGGSND